MLGEGKTESVCVWGGGGGGDILRGGTEEEREGERQKEKVSLALRSVFRLCRLRQSQSNCIDSPPFASLTCVLVGEYKRWTTEIV